MGMYQRLLICRAKAFLATRWNFWSKLQKKTFTTLTDLLPLEDSATGTEREPQ